MILLHCLLICGSPWMRRVAACVRFLFPWEVWVLMNPRLSPLYSRWFSQLCPFQTLGPVGGCGGESHSRPIEAKRKWCQPCPDYRDSLVSGCTLTLPYIWNRRSSNCLGSATVKNTWAITVSLSTTLFMFCMKKLNQCFWLCLVFSWAQTINSIVFHCFHLWNTF